MKSGLSQLQQKLERSPVCLPGPVDSGLACVVNGVVEVTAAKAFKMDGFKVRG